MNWLRDNWLVRFIRHNPGLFIAILMCSFLAGCAFYPFKVTDPLDPTRKITQEQLESQIEIGRNDLTLEAQALAVKAKNFEQRAKASVEEVEKHQNFIAGVLKTINDLALSSGVPGVGLGVATATTLLGGLFFDNRRKDGKLRVLTEAPAVVAESVVVPSPAAIAGR